MMYERVSWFAFLAGQVLGNARFWLWDLDIDGVWISPVGDSRLESTFGSRRCGCVDAACSSSMSSRGDQGRGEMMGAGRTFELAVSTVAADGGELRVHPERTLHFGPKG